MIPLCPVKKKVTYILKNCNYSIWTEMGMMQYFQSIHADIGSEKLNGLPDIKLQICGTSGGRYIVSFFFFFSLSTLMCFWISNYF